MRFLATIFSLVDILSFYLPKNLFLYVDDQFIHSQKSYPPIWRVLGCIFVQSEVMSNFLWIHLPQRGGITTWRNASLSEGARSDELIQCLVLHTHVG